MQRQFMPHVGKTYMVSHDRKGSFTLRVSKVSPDWVEGELVLGNVAMMNAENNVDTGGTVTVRRTLISGYMEVTEPAPVPATAPDSTL